LTKSGFLRVKDPRQPSRFHTLYANAYTKTVDPYVVFSWENSLRSLSRPFAFIKLKSCRAEPLKDAPLAFQLIPTGERMGDGPAMMVFYSDSVRQRDEWIKCLTIERTHAKVCSRSCLPTIEEFTDRDSDGVTLERRPSLVKA